MKLYNSQYFHTDRFCTYRTIQHISKLLWLIYREGNFKQLPITHYIITRIGSSKSQCTYYTWKSLFLVQVQGDWQCGSFRTMFCGLQDVLYVPAETDYGKADQVICMFNWNFSIANWTEGIKLSIARYNRHLSHSTSAKNEGTNLSKCTKRYPLFIHSN